MHAKLYPKPNVIRWHTPSRAPHFYVLLIAIAVLWNFGSDAAGVTASNKPSNKIYVVVADELTPYGIMGRYLEQRLESKWNFQIAPNMKGSFDALLQLEASKSSLAIVQADVLYHYLRGGHPQLPLPQQDSSVRAIVRLFPEWLSITVHKDLQIDDESVIRTFENASAGKVGSGSLVTAINLGSMVQSKWIGAYRDYPMTPKLDSIEFRVQSPSSVVDSRANARLVFPPKSTMLPMVSGFGDTYRLVEVLEINKKLNQGLADVEASTIAVDAVLVGNADVPSGIIMEILEILEGLDSASVIKATGTLPPVKDGTEIQPSHILQYTSFTDYDAEERRKKLPVAVHPHIRLQRSRGEARYDKLSPKLVEIHAKSPILFMIAVASTLIVAWIIAWSLSKAVGFIGNRVIPERYRVISGEALSRWALLGAVFVLSHGVVGTCVWISEYFAETMEKETDLAVGGALAATFKMIEMVAVGTSPDLRSEFSVWWIALLKSGYAVATLLATVAVGKSITDWIRSVTLRNHVLVVGWNSRGSLLVRELRAQKRDFVVLAMRLDEDGDNSLAKAAESYQGAGQFVQDNVSTEQLEKANIKLSRAVIVLSDDCASLRSGYGDPDLWVLSTISTIKKCTPESLNITHKAESEATGTSDARSPFVIAEVRNPSNTVLAREQGADEAFCVDTFGTELLVHAAKDPRLVTVFRNLLKTSDDNIEVYLRPVAKEWHNKDLGVISTKGKGLIIGVLKKGESVPEMNPQSDTKMEIGDQLIFLADHEKDVTLIPQKESAQGAGHSTPPKKNPQPNSQKTTSGNGKNRRRQRKKRRK